MRSPLTGIVVILELTHAWNDLLPLVVASVSAYALSALLLKRSVLTEKIARRRLPDPRIHHRPAGNLLRPRGHDPRSRRAARHRHSACRATRHPLRDPVPGDRGCWVTGRVNTRGALPCCAGRSVGTRALSCRVGHPGMPTRPALLTLRRAAARRVLPPGCARCLWLPSARSGLSTARRSCAICVRRCLARRAGRLACCDRRCRAAIGTTAPDRAEAADPLVPLSVPEIRRLLCLLEWQAPADPVRVLGWSWWRRRHQARARRCHWRRQQHRRKVRL
jgi:hypothetical protein